MPAAEARALPTATPRPVATRAAPAPDAVAQPARITAPRAPDAPRHVDAVHPPADRMSPTPSPLAAERGDQSRAEASDGPAVVRNAAGRAIDPAVADRLRAEPLVRQVTDILDAPVQRVVPRRARPAPAQDEGE
ncbi:MAG: hypothetical protein FJ270_06870 [Planctomycetes bacterium]|nr:hypothetical protein [Planctomycetota bacterium]